MGNVQNIFDKLARADLPATGGLGNLTSGRVFGWGTTVPSDDDAGYLNGCLFIDTDASDGANAFINDGDIDDCDFNLIVIT